MCGILGISGINTESIMDAISLLEHRGPDDNGIFIDKFFEISLGHQRLAILDTSSFGHQPMLSDDSKVVLVFNGEIYNYKELRSDLRKKGFIFRGESDTEVLLNLYLSEGKKMLSRLNGVFAFVHT